MKIRKRGRTILNHQEKNVRIGKKKIIKRRGKMRDRKKREIDGMNDGV